MKKLFTILMVLMVQSSFSQEVNNTSFTNRAGEKLLRLEIVLPVGLEKAWQMFTSDSSLRQWIAPVAHIELKSGGYILTNYDQEKQLTDSSSIKLPIINFLEKEMITLKVDLNNNFPEVVQKEDRNLQEIIQFKKEDDSHTRIVSTMVGFGNGKDWEKTYMFFTKGNTWTYKELLKLFK